MKKRNITNAEGIAGKHKKAQAPNGEIDLYKDGEYPEESFECRFTRITMHKFLASVLHKPYVDKAINKTHINFDPNMEVYQMISLPEDQCQPSANYIWTNETEPIHTHGDAFRVIGPGMANMSKSQTIADHLGKNFMLSRSKILVHAGIGALASIIQSGLPDSFKKGEYLIAGVCFDINRSLFVPSIKVETDASGTRTVTYNAVPLNTIIQERKFLAVQKPRT